MAKLELTDAQCVQLLMALKNRQEFLSDLRLASRDADAQLQQMFVDCADAELALKKYLARS